MNHELEQIQKELKGLHPETFCEAVPLYPGIALWYLSLTGEPVSIPHRLLGRFLQIHYCISGQIVWQMGNCNRISLNPGNFSLHTMNTCADTVLTSPAGRYQGILICIDLQEASAHPPEPLEGTGIFERILKDKFCRNDAAAFFAGDEQTAAIFRAFYEQPEELRLPYQKIKVLELLVYLARTSFPQQNKLAEYPAEQLEIVREIHDRLLSQIGHRITIEELSRQYLINPTTLKSAFKAVYGTSLAAHIKEHRMEQAAKLLRESDRSIAEIAQAVGYDSQSKFSAAFKAFFHVLPKDYRKR